MSRMNGVPKTAQQLGLMESVAIEQDPENVVTLANWQQPPYNRWGFQHVQDLIPTARIRRSVEPPTPLVQARRHIRDIPCPGPNGENITLGRLLQLTYTDAFLVMCNGELVSEDYFNGMQVDSHHLLMSCTKSYVGCLAGIFVEQGLLDPTAPVTEYVPDFAETGFAGSTLRQCLDMRCGLKWSEDYDDLSSDVRRSEVAYGWAPMPQGYSDPITSTDFMLTRRGILFEHGEKFEYRSGITTGLGMIIEKVTGRRIQDLLTEYIWQPLGCEWDATIAVDRANAAQTDGGLSCTARDWLRFGQMMAQRGSFNGRQIVPEAWVQDCRFGDDTCRAAFARGVYAEVFAQISDSAEYRNQWWGLDSKKGILMASGIHGQTLMVDPINEVVIAKFSTTPQAADLELAVCQVKGMLAVAEHLGHEGS